MRGPSRSGDQTSAQEVALAKALKPRKKFRSGSSGLSLAEKASAAKVGVHKGKESLPGVSGVGMTSKALDLFGSTSSASEDETIGPTPTLNKTSSEFSPKNFLKVFCPSRERCVDTELVF
jgi:hypothetical protein